MDKIEKWKQLKEDAIDHGTYVHLLWEGHCTVNPVTRIRISILARIWKYRRKFRRWKERRK